MGRSSRRPKMGTGFRPACEAFGRFDLEEVAVTYKIGTANGGGQPAGELIVRG